MIDDNNGHPNVHQAWKPWSEDQRLHVAAAYSNPFRWRVRRELANDFRQHMAQQPNVVLHFGELAYGDRPFEVTDQHNSNDVQLRTDHELFHKENILNRVIESFPAGWKYGAWVDADFQFTRHDWALEAIHQLQHYQFVQLFSSYTDLTGKTYGTGHRPLHCSPGFAYTYIQNGYKLIGWREKKDNWGYYYQGRWPGAVGGAWAFRRSALDTVGGLLDQCILGSGDSFMAFGLVGESGITGKHRRCHSDYIKVIEAWQANAAALDRNIGYIDSIAVHHFHGSKARRFYGSRDDILIQHQISPLRHIKRDSQGIYQLNTGHGLRDAVRAYFLSRGEDDPNLYGHERPMV